MSRLASDSKSNINDKNIRTDTVWHLGVCECVKCYACRDVIKSVCVVRNVLRRLYALKER